LHLHTWWKCFTACCSVITSVHGTLEPCVRRQ